MLSKSTLAVRLSKLKGFLQPKLASEQYATDSETAADLLWLAFMNGDVKNKVIADFGCGTGILGVGCLLLDAKKVYFIDNDPSALETAKANLSSLKGKYELIESAIAGVGLKTDVVIQNPPFGTKRRHADKEFLLKAFETAGVVYSIHKASTVEFVSRLALSNGFQATHVLRRDLPLKRQHGFHRRRIHRIEVACIRMVRL